MMLFALEKISFMKMLNEVLNNITIALVMSDLPSKHTAKIVGIEDALAEIRKAMLPLLDSANIACVDPGKDTLKLLDNEIEGAYEFLGKDSTND